MAETDYKLHYQTTYQGIPVSVENRKGSIRRGTNRYGESWEIKMNYAYGRIPRTRGADGDMLDVYLGPEKDAANVYIIEQVDPETGRFDEHKCMLGFKTKADAVSGYKSQYTKPGFYGGCITKTIEEFKDWIKELTPAKTERRNMENRVVNGVRVVDYDKNSELFLRKLYDLFRNDDGELNFFENRYNLKDLDGYPKFVDLEIFDIMGLYDDHANFNAGGDWQQSVNFSVYLKNGNLVVGDVANAMDSQNQKELKDRVKHVEEMFRTGGDAMKTKTRDLKLYGENGKLISDEDIGWDAMVKKLMKENGYTKEVAQKVAYKIGKAKYGKEGMAKKAAAGRDSEPALTVLQNSGTHTGTDYTRFDQKELALGILVELEHADSIPIAAEIAADHLAETPDYYSDPENPFLKEIMEEYRPSKIESGDAEIADALPVLTEALLTPILRSLMKNFGFKKLVWKGSGWAVPIGFNEYATYLKKIPALKVFDRLLEKFGYEISISPLWFSINPVKIGA